MSAASGGEPGWRSEWGWVAAVAAVAAAPTATVILGRHLPVPHDGFVSDLTDGEWPLRVDAGRLLVSQGPWAWSEQVLLGTGVQPDPWNLLYALVPPVTALGLHWALLLAIAAAGSFGLARQHGASRWMAALAGIGFAWSGFFASQLRHLTIMGVVVWFPVALWCIERAAGAVGLDELAPRSFDQRARWALAFAAVWGMQVLAGFPQTAYYAALVYALWIAGRMVALARVRARDALAFGGLLGAATAAGVVLGAAALLPMAELAALSDRGRGMSWAFSSMAPFDLGMTAQFFVPYVWGDGSQFGIDLFPEVRAMRLFWEGYGYVGWLSVPGIVGFCLLRRANTAVGLGWILIAQLAFVVVLGPWTPLYRLMWDWLPLMKSFRFPTRFLFVLELALVQLAAHGLGGLLRSARLQALVFAVYAADLLWWNRRQLPLVDAAGWMEVPTVAALAERPPGRMYGRDTFDRQMDAFFAARAWQTPSAYLSVRPLLTPNSGAVFGIPSVTGYVGLAPDHQAQLVGVPGGVLDQLGDDPVALGRLLDLVDGRYVVDRPGRAVDGVVGTRAVGDLVLLERPGAARVRVVHQAVQASGEGLVAAIRTGALDPRTVAWFPDGTPLPSLGPGPGSASIVADTVDRIEVEATSQGAGLLVLADAWHPGWQATRDGAPVAVQRVDLALRGVALPDGTHRVVFTWTGGAARRGVWVSALGAGALVLAAAVLAWRSRRMASDAGAAA